MAKIDWADLKGVKLDELFNDWRDEAMKRAGGLMTEGRGQVKRGRRAVADPNDGDMFGAFILGLTVGALVGAAFALLMTPVSGSEARRRLAEQAEKVRGGEDGPEWESGGASGMGNGKTSYQATPTYGTAPVR